MKTSQWVPGVCGGIAVRQNYRSSNWDIYRYNFSTEKKFQIASETDDKNFVRR